MFEDMVTNKAQPLEKVWYCDLVGIHTYSLEEVGCGGFEVSKAKTNLSVFFFLIPMDLDVDFSATSAWMTPRSLP